MADKQQLAARIAADPELLAALKDLLGPTDTGNGKAADPHALPVDKFGRFQFKSAQAASLNQVLGMLEQEAAPVPLSVRLLKAVEGFDPKAATVDDTGKWPAVRYGGLNLGKDLEKAAETVARIRKVCG